jgi:hypothetical protein
MLYTVVNEGYDVMVFRNVKAVFRWVSGDEFGLGKEAETPVTLDALKKHLRGRELAYIYEMGESDWKYKIETHKKVLR